MVLESNTLDVLFVKDGQQGEDGKILYTWIKYAKDANGIGMTDDPNGAVYIGISYNNESSTESNDPTQYAWTKIQGADGKKGEDAYTIFLENENISFATDENRDPLSEQAYTSGITIMKGAKPVTDFTIGDIAKTQGIAVAKTDTAIAISVINGNPLPSDNGEIVIPITVGGTVFKKILSWTCSKKGDKGIQGIQGPQGVQGEKGKDGTSVTISNKSITYQLSASGTVVPTGTWQTSPQTIPEGQYQWTKTSVTYSDGNKTESYSISYRGKNGSDGTSVKTTSTSVKYQVGDSGTTKPTGTWQNSVPTVAQGKYLWTQTIVNYSDGNSTESYSVSYRGIDGSNGVNGMNAATVYLYQRATSTPSKPSNTLTYTFSTTTITGTLNNGWSTAIPTGTDAVYVTVASVSSKNDTATIATSAWSAPVVLAQNGKTGGDGKAGLNVATIYLYQRNTSKPSKPSASVTYTFSTGVASGLNNGWSQKIPDGANPLYVTLATASSNTATDTILSSEWSDVVVMAQNGEDGQDGKNATYITVSGTNYDAVTGINDKASYLVINGVKYNYNSLDRGHTLAVINPSNGAVESIKTYDTYKTPSALDEPLTAVVSGKIICLFTADASGLSQNSRNTLIGCGSAVNSTWSESRTTHVFIGMKGLQKGQAYEIVGGATQIVTAYYTDSGIVTNGAVGSDGISPKVSLSKTGDTTTISIVDATGTHTQTVKDGTNGTPGAAGKNGKTSYFHVKYSNDGGKTFTGNSGEDTGIYMGSYTDYTEIDSTDVKKYNWVKVSGDNFSWNLINNGKGNVKKGFFKNFSSVNATEKYGEITLTSKHHYIGIDLPGFVLNPRQYEVGKKVTWSYDIMYTKWDFPTGSNRQEYWIGQRYTGAPSGETATGQWVGVTSHNLPVVGQNGCELNKWFHVEVTKTIPTPASSNVGYQECINFYNSTDISATVTLRMKNVKLEYGDTATPWSPSQSDLEGRGISQTVQYYLATSQASGVTSSTSGWSTDITTQKLTADKKYLWNCYQTKYSDDTMTLISTPAIIGVYGDKGQKGDNAKNLSITPSSQYFKSTDGGKTFAPNAIIIKPTIQGEISFGKWQYSIDGGVSFADVVSGQKGLTVNNNVLTVNKDSSLYSDAVTMVTFRAVASDSSFYDTCSIAKIYDVSDIGDGRNLLTGVSSYTKDTPFEKTDSRADGWTMYQNIITSIELEAGKKYVLQAKTDGNWAANHDINGQDPSKKLVTLWLCSDKTNNCFDMRQGYAVFTPTVTAKYKLRVNQYSNGTDAYTIHLWDIKLEKGSFPTGWTPAPEDLQTAILSTKSEISDVSLKVDKNKQAIEQRVEKTTYQQDLNLVKGDISKANEGLNKWRYEIYPKSLFASEYQGKSTMDVFAKNTNLTPSQSVLINDMDLSIAWNYDNNYIGYALTFAKFSAAKSVAITFAHDDGAHIYLNGKLIGGSDAYSQTGESLTLGFVKGWNCIEVVVNEGASTEGFKLGTTISAISECQLMNCYYGTPVARQSHITNQLVQNTTDIDGVSGSVQKVMSTVGGSGKIDEFVNNYSTWKKKVDGIETRVGETYTTKSDFNGLEIGGRNLLTKDDCNMSKWQNLYPAHCKVTNNDYSNHIDYVPTGGEWEIIYKKISVTKGQKYILSFDYKVNKAYNYLSGQKYGVYLSTSVPTNAAPTNIITDGQYAIENTVTSIKRGVITFTAPIDTLYIAINGGCIDDNQTGLSFEFNKWKLEKGNKATDWTPASEDNKINGQNLVSNLPTNWEQGSVQCNTGSIYSGIKTATTTRLRVKDVFSVSGNVTISAGTSTNSSKEDLNFYYVLFDVNKKEISNSSTWQSLTSAKIINCGDAKYMAIILRWGSATTMMNPSDISQICLKIERGTSATPFTLAPEDVNGKIVNVETIANQTANKFEWIVKGGDSSSNFTLTDRVADLVAERINFKGLVTFSGLSTDAKNEIGKVAQSKVDGLEVGGRNLIINSNLSRTLTNVTNDGCSNMTVVSDSVYGHALKFTAVNQRRVFWATSNVWVKDKTYTVSFVAKSSVTGQKIRPSRSTADWGDDITLTTSYARYTTKITSLDTNAGGTLSFSCTNAVGDITITNVKLEVGNKATDWTPAPEDVSQDATNKASQALTDAKNYSSNAVNWVTNNGSSTTSLNSMVKKWTDGAVSDTTQINGGWIKANTITASKIAVGDFTNYADINESNTYGFSVEKTTDGVWFSKDGSKLTRDNYISKMYSCEPGQTFYVEYDISNTIKDSTEYKAAGIMLFGCDGTQTVKWYQRRGAVVGTAAGTVTHMSQQLTMPSGTRFFYVVLQIEGFQPFTGTLKIRNLSVRKAVTGAVIVDGSITADKIATDAIKSRNYISSGGTQGSFLNLSNGSFQSPNLSWDSNGNLIAKNANLSGQITATKGSIGKYEITDQWLTTGSGSTCTGIGGNQAFWAGGEDSNSAPFRVGYDGKLTSSNADISGKITAINGTIGKYEITDTYLKTGSGSTCSGFGSDYAFWAGNDEAKYAPFRVEYDGTLNIEHITVHGNQEDVYMKIGKNYLTIQDVNTSAHIGLDGFDFDFANSRIRTGDQGIELYGDTPYIDFHYDNSYNDYTSRIIAQSGWDCLTFTGSILLGADLYAKGYIYNSSGGHYTWDGRTDAYISCGNYNNTNNIYYYAGYHAFYVNGDSGSGMMYIDTSGVSSRKGFRNSSDERIKQNFSHFDDNFIDTYMNLEPVQYQFKNDTNDKYHFGFKAQQTERILNAYGQESDKSYGICATHAINPEKAEKLYGVKDMHEEYTLAYDELIAPTTYMVQHTYKELESTKNELEQVKQEKADLEARLQIIEAKLGL